MGVILQGILGGFSGKVGPVVGGKWKDVDYMRSYVVPANPNTTSQQTVRAKFAKLVLTARSLLPAVLQPYWDSFYSNMSGFNAWISQNYAGATSAGILDQDAVMTTGTLEPTLEVSCIYDTATGNTSSTYDSSINGNGENSDKSISIVYDKSTGLTYTNIDNVTRADGADAMSLPTGLTASNLYYFISFYRGSGASLIVSDSKGCLCTDH